ncbi:hypothetical protein BJ508DRAFT_316110 [Ascobolus immersus RN42]|uniref:Uncharacterized protein n=1 Tax=Ascobolus immersus RN42 TaxID=1160509 RepID=A0A3N4H7R7_ASCIM|nr:hypothetical protein BJ508DRAFT_316110 [Ascobolus immersus RN42]
MIDVDEEINDLLNEYCEKVEKEPVSGSTGTDNGADSDSELSDMDTSMLDVPGDDEVEMLQARYKSTWLNTDTTLDALTRQIDRAQKEFDDFDRATSPSDTDAWNRHHAVAANIKKLEAKLNEKDKDVHEMLEIGVKLDVAYTPTTTPKGTPPPKPPTPPPTSPTSSTSAPSKTPSATSKPKTKVTKQESKRAAEKKAKLLDAKAQADLAKRSRVFQVARLQRSLYPASVKQARKDGKVRDPQCLLLQKELYEGSEEIENKRKEWAELYAKDSEFFSGSDYETDNDGNRTRPKNGKGKGKVPAKGSSEETEDIPAESLVGVDELVATTSDNDNDDSMDLDLEKLVGFQPGTKLSDEDLDLVTAYKQNCQYGVDFAEETCAVLKGEYKPPIVEAKDDDDDDEDFDYFDCEADSESSEDEEDDE